MPEVQSIADVRATASFMFHSVEMHYQLKDMDSKDSGYPETKDSIETKRLRL
jgi:hypothetical protein